MSTILPFVPREPRRRRPHHWHVEVGPNGHGPDDIQCFPTRRAAERFAVDEAHDHVDAGYVVGGSARALRYDVGWERGVWFRHITIEPHDDVACDWLVNHA